MNHMANNPPQTVRLAVPSMGALISLTADDWTNISELVCQVLSLLRGWVALGNKSPGFYSFASDTCVKWRVQTFPAIGILSAQIIKYADNASAGLTVLRNDISQLKAGEELTPAQLSAAQMFFANIASLTTQLNVLTGMIAKSVNDFSTQYAAISAGWARSSGNTMYPDKVVTAAGELDGAWQSVSDDLGQVMSGQIPITSTLLLSLDIDLALLSWQNLRAEAAGFADIAPGQQKILDNGWNGGILQASEG